MRLVLRLRWYDWLYRDEDTVQNAAKGSSSVVVRSCT